MHACMHTYEHTCTYAPITNTHLAQEPTARMPSPPKMHERFLAIAHKQTNKQTNKHKHSHKQTRLRTRTLTEQQPRSHSPPPLRHPSLFPAATYSPLSPTSPYLITMVPSAASPPPFSPTSAYGMFSPPPQQPPSGGSASISLTTGKLIGIHSMSPPPMSPVHAVPPMSPVHAVPVQIYSPMMGPVVAQPMLTVQKIVAQPKEVRVCVCVCVSVYVYVC